MVKDNRYTLLFAAAVCISCSLIVSSAAVLLKEKQDQNFKTDIRKNILLAVDLIDASGDYTAKEIDELFSTKIEAKVLSAEGKEAAGLHPESLSSEQLESGFLPLYIRRDNETVQAYAFPIEGKGLWSTLYGYLALEADATTVKGITFYKHGETPGLGAEIEQPWFQNNFKGKRVLNDEGDLVSVGVVKGKVKDIIAVGKQPHYVDGISGATITSRGVTDLLAKGLRDYDPFFQAVRVQFAGGAR